MDALKKASLDAPHYTELSILKTYVNEKICTEKTINANLYICKDLKKGDTLYVFEICDKVAWFAKEELHENFVILKEDIKTNIPDSVSILVPKSMVIPTNTKYVFSNLTRLED